MASFLANLDSLTAVRAAFARFEQCTKECYTAFSQSVSRSEPLLDGKTRAELSNTLASVNALTVALVRYSSKNVHALNHKLDCLAELIDVMHQ